MEFCGECGAGLTKSCPGCNSIIRWQLKHCPKCGVNIGEKLVEEQKRKDEAERLATEREAERRRIEEERLQQEEKKLKEKEEKLLRKKVWRKKHGWKVAASIVVVAVGLAAGSYLKSDAYAYLRAERLYNSEDYPGAVSAFEALRDYRDSPSRVLECYLATATLYAEQGSLDSAAVIIQTRLMDEDSISADLELLLQSYPVIGAYLLPGNMAFASVPAGSFSMGSPSSESERGSDEGPVHTVNIQSFELMTTEVTQAMWEEVMGTNPSNFTGDPNRPVENVSWNDCQEFITRINDFDLSYTYSLPSEAEWEYACRAGTTTRYYWGNDPNSTEIDQYAWYTDNSNSTTHPVGQKLPNAWGLYDMSGNVLEWCADWYHESYSGAPTDGSAWVSPSGSYRVIRGGSWNYSAGGCRAADRYGIGPDSGVDFLGFRLARSVR
jgi:formylglycine-generating enzyme required for sulfatase activity